MRSREVSPPGSPALTSQISMGQLRPVRSRGDTQSPPPEQLRTLASGPTSAPRSTALAHRSRSINGGGIDRQRVATDIKTAATKARGGTVSNEPEVQKKPKGIVAFLSRKKGERGKSPAATKKYPEGVLGKDGARVWQKETQP